MRCFLIIVLCICFFLNGCTQKEEQSKGNERREQTNGDTLEVYMFGDHMSSSGEEPEDFYQTRFTLGDYKSRSLFWGEEAHMYYDAIQEFERNKDIDVEVIFFNSTYAILEQLEQDKMNGTEPDVIIGSCATGGSDIAAMFDKEVFYDMSTLFEEHEIYASQNYINPVLKAGEVKGKQLLFPMSFNMNLLMTSKENMVKYDMIDLRQATYDDMMRVFQNSWMDTGRGEKEILLKQFSSTSIRFPYQLFEAASGISLFSEDYSELTLDEIYLRELTDLYEAYLCDDLGITVEELRNMKSVDLEYLYTHSKSQNWEAKMDPMMIDRFSQATNSIRYFAEGGLSSPTLHSFAAQAYYFESRYAELQEEFICTGIPMREDPNAYAATVTTFGAIIDDSNKVEMGFAFIKSLTDAKRHMFYDLSVNKKSMEESFKQMEELTTEFYPMNGTFPPEDVPEGEDWLGESYTLKPLSKETSVYLREMIEKIGYAVLPNNLTSSIVCEEIERFIFGELDQFEVALASAKERVRNEV